VDDEDGDGDELSGFRGLYVRDFGGDLLARVEWDGTARACAERNGRLIVVTDDELIVVGHTRVPIRAGAVDFVDGRVAYVDTEGEVRVLD
jgi:hypothetical protein